jgi:hypothetical protein
VFQDQPNVTETLMEMLEYDPSPDIRVSILLSVDLEDSRNQELVIAKLTQRARDLDANVRKSFYARLAQPGLKDVLGPAKLREIYGIGLLDRDQSVCKACLDGICKKWVESGNVYGLYLELDQAKLLDGEVKGMPATEKILKHFFEQKSDYSKEYDGMSASFTF